MSLKINWFLPLWWLCVTAGVAGRAESIETSAPPPERIALLTAYAPETEALLAALFDATLLWHGLLGTSGATRFSLIQES